MSEGLDRPAVTRRAVLGAAAGAVALSGADTAAAQETVSYGDWFTSAATGGATDNFDGSTVDERGSASVTIDVGATGNGGPFAFRPPAARIDPGTTVTFEWLSDTHNVVVEDRPEGSKWAGHEPVEDIGFTYEHTFETEGLCTYYCEPHLSLGMKGAIVVGDAEIADAGEAGGDGSAWTWPGDTAGASFIALLFGSVGLAALVVLGGDGLDAVRRWRRAAVEAAASPLKEASPGSDIVEELGYDDFDPTGTAALIVLYFLVLVGMWVFVYFVEFLGNGPTVVG